MQVQRRLPPSEVTLVKRSQPPMGGEKVLRQQISFLRTKTTEYPGDT